MSLAVQITSTFIKGADAALQNGDIFFCGSGVGDFAVAHQQKTGQIPGYIKYGVRLDSHFVFAAVSPSAV